MPKVGDIYIFTYAHHINFFAVIVKETSKTFKLIHIGKITVKVLNSTPSQSSKEIKPDLNEQIKIFTVYKKNYYMIMVM